MTLTDKPVLDACCGVKAIWYDKHNPHALYMDNRTLDTKFHHNHMVIAPDIVADFQDMPFEDNTFQLVVFEPPSHIRENGSNYWKWQQYGYLPKEGWGKVLKNGFKECWRVLKPMGTLVFLWTPVDVTIPNVIKLIDKEPMLCTKSGNGAYLLLYIKGLE